MSPRATSQRIYLVRHGETEWSQSGRHTSRTDLPLTAEGERRIESIAATLAAHPFSLVLSSPLRRAVRTCELAGLRGRAELDADLVEWNYGDYEGLTTAEIREQRPAWNLFHDGAPGGESAEEVGARVARAIGRIVDAEGDVAVFAHGHVLRVLGALWVGHAPEDAERLALDTGSVSILGYEREARVIRLWNGRV
ncbi:MAG: histidine phosphatase family protein [Planctomycetaceae bacterium]|jgi:probable phosphoglycerate mutase|nr:histidine phosphatase family protein [Planctomycetaceae bacterium]